MAQAVFDEYDKDLKSDTLSSEIRIYKGEESLEYTVEEALIYLLINKV